MRKSEFFCISLCLLLVFNNVMAQKNPLNELPSDLQSRNTLTPAFYEKENMVGSVYLSNRWMRGTVEFVNHKRLPAPGQFMVFNFDKIKNILYMLTDTSKVLAFPIDSVSSIEMEGNSKTYSFQKISWISNSYYLMPVFTSNQGYSLYKRLFTKAQPADFFNGGYYTTGKKYDEYVDYYEYYLTYPGNNQYQKLTLKESVIRKALKDESKLVNEFFSLHENDINLSLIHI